MKMHQDFKEYEDPEDDCEKELDFENGLRFVVEDEDEVYDETVYFAPGWCGRPRTERLKGC